MTNQPLVSVITACYNGAEFIEHTIKSVQNQTYTNWELLIIDDFSKDNSTSIIMNYCTLDSRIKLFENIKNRGAGYTRNVGVEASVGRFIAFLDADDQWYPEKLEEQISFMLSNNYSLTFTAYDTIEENSLKKGRREALESVNYKNMLVNNYLGCLTVIYDKDKLGKFYFPEIRKRQDWALWLQIMRSGIIAHGINKPLALYNKRKDSISRNKIKLLKYNWTIYRECEKFSIVKSIILISQLVMFKFYKSI